MIAQRATEARTVELWHKKTNIKKHRCNRAVAHIMHAPLRSQDEVMTRRYGWRAVLKALKIEGTHKESEVEIKILPVNTLSKVKQASWSLNDLV